MSTAPLDCDSPWKEALEHYFKDFMAFFFPTAHAGIDWTRGYEFLDKELQRVVRDAELGRRLVDKLVRVWRLEGEEAWVMIHIEVQGQVEEGFAKRMYIYHYRLFDRYDRPVVSLAVLGDERPTWRPEGYGYGLWGCQVQFAFPVVKLLDYQARWEALEQSRNPFAVLVMAQLKAQQTRRDPEDRMRWKLQLVKGLYQQGYTQEEILELFRFIDWVMVLPEDLETRFEETLLSYEQEVHMPYITSIERKGIQQGLQQGLQQGIREGLLAGIELGLELRFGDEGLRLLPEIRQIEEVEVLRAIHAGLKRVGSLDELRGIYP